MQQKDMDIYNEDTKEDLYEKIILNLIEGKKLENYNDKKRIL